jgi:hydrogenase-1 operon protein HyaE
MNDLIVPPEWIDLPPVLVRLAKLTDATLVGADRYDAWSGQRGNTMVVFAKDSEHFEATLDLVGVVPELRATAGGALRVGLLAPAASRAIAPRYGLIDWPAFVMLRDGHYLGAAQGVRDWTFYTTELLRMLSASAKARSASGGR